MLPSASEHLGPVGEQEWRRLRRQYEWGDRFWLVFLFVISPRTAKVMRARALGVARGADAALFVLNLRGAEATRSAPADLLALPEGAGVWLAATEGDPTLHRDLLARLNERRDALRRRLGGVVIALPASLKPDLPALAPDLWSVRDLVVQPPALPVAADTARSPDRSSLSDPSASPPPDPDMALAEATRRTTEGARARDLLRAIDGLLDAGRTMEASRTADLAIEAARAAREPPLVADALYHLARAGEAEGDLLVAEGHLSRALQMIEGEESWPQLWWFQLKRRLALRRLDLTAALEAARGAHGLTLRLRAAGGRAAEANVAWALNQVGDIEQRLGNIEDAANAFKESLRIRRTLRDTYGDSPETLRDVFVSTWRVGRLALDTQRPAEARTHADEALATTRRLVERYGEQWHWRDLVFALHLTAEADPTRQEALQAEAEALEKRYG